jgi:hypothetical protein
MKFLLFAFAVVCFARDTLAAVVPGVSPRRDNLAGLLADFENGETDWQGVDGVQSLDDNCKTLFDDARDSACSNPIDTTSAKIITEAEFNQMRNNLNATLVRKYESEPELPRPHGEAFLVYKGPRECNWYSNSGVQCLSYHVELLSTGAVWFHTEIENHSIDSLKYGVACGMLDAKGNMYTLARSGHLVGKFFHGSKNGGVHQTRDDHIIHEGVRDNWEHIMGAAVPCLGPKWGKRPIFVCKPLMATSVIVNVAHKREWAKRSMMIKLENNLREFGDVTKFIDLFI